MRFTSAFLVGLAACATQQPAAPSPVAANEVVAAAPPPASFQPDPGKPMPPGLDEAAIDPKADPCVDFYQYACGGWMAKTEIPADRALYSRGFVSVLERNEQLMKTILEEAASGALPAGTPFAAHLGDAYATCMDEPGLEKALPELKRFVAQTIKTKNVEELAVTLGALHSAGFHPLFELGVTQDLKNSSEVIGALDQAGLGLPDRDYYLDDDKKPVREQYRAHVEAMFALLVGDPKASQRAAENVLALETRLAKVAQSRIDRRDPEKLYNRVDRKGLVEQAKAFPWAAYFKAVGATELTALNVNSVPYFVELAAIAKDTKPEPLKDYLTWHVLRGSVLALPKAFQDEAFRFTSSALTGAKADRPRWKKCVAFVDEALGEALGREFVRRAFGEDGKTRTSAMVEALLSSFELNLLALSWFDEPTRTAALLKAKRMVGNNKLGYPAMWRDYSALKTDRSSFFANALAADRFEFRRQLAKVGKPVDRNEWLMSPPTVNAYYDPQKNEIVFPAGILQPPFFNRAATDAVNFGSMGMVVGHEITHGFDDEGRKYDLDGNVKDWWTKAVGDAFVKKAECVNQQYSAYPAIGELKVKGDLTLGENIADLGGLKLAHAAMKNWYAGKAEADAQYRYTRGQQFFLGFAQSWCTKMRDENAKVRAVTDPHAPPYWRVNGPLGNLDDFTTAFQCKAGARMVRTGPARCEVW